VLFWKVVRPANRCRALTWAVLAASGLTVLAAVAGCAHGPQHSAGQGPENKTHITHADRMVARPLGSFRDTDLRAAARGTNVVICVLDDARYDHFGCYGYPRATTPNIDRLAHESVVFDQHFSQIPYTRPSTASLLTSQHPDTHGLLDGRGSLAPSTFTLEAGLKRAGWRTAFFTESTQASPKMGVGGDFEHVWEGVRLGRWGPTEVLLRALPAWLDEGPGQPFFVYLHLLHPHVPYEPPAQFIERFADTTPPKVKAGQGRFWQGSPASNASRWQNVNLYDANLCYGDWAISEVEQVLRQRGLFDHTLLIITSDHGEPFGEHAPVRRELSVYDEALHIPLVVRLPSRTLLRGRVNMLTQTIDVLPTILDLVGVSYPRAGVQGSSLLPVLAGQTQALHDHTIARTDDGRPPKWHARYLVRTARWALILEEGGIHRELYDVAADPGETRDLIAAQPRRVAELLRTFRTFAVTQPTRPLGFSDRGFKAPPHRPVPPLKQTEETRKRLRALGYVD
jgi:choline-sulfatase